MKKPILIALVVLACVGYFVASPYLAVHRLQADLQSGDQIRLEDDVDFPAVRENIKDQLNAVMTKKLSDNAGDLQNNPFASLAGLFASKLVDAMVDSFVTPAGLSKLMEGVTDPNKASQPGRKPLDKAALGFDGLSRFKMDIQGDDGKHIDMYLYRSGLSWRLSRIVLPLDGL